MSDPAARLLISCPGHDNDRGMVLVCSPNDYTGGELQFFDRSEPTRIPLEQLESGFFFSRPFAYFAGKTFRA